MVLDPPSDTDLGQIFARTMYNPSGQNTVPGARIESVLLSDDGTPFVNITAPFDGAYTGLEEAAFVRTSGGWRPDVSDTVPTQAGNRWVAAAERRSKVVIVGDYRDELPGDAGFIANQDEVVLVDERAQNFLGHGIATAVRGRYVTGYDAGFPGLHKLGALEWIDRRRVRLGAGIAWSANAAGDVVGDDRASLDVAGHPMLWHRGRPVRLSAGTGSAFAISDRGTIVGAIGDDGFVIQPGGRRAITRLDTVIRDRGWHVSSAFAIASEGSLLAVASRHGNDPKVVLLKRSPAIEEPFQAGVR